MSTASSSFVLPSTPSASSPPDDDDIDSLPSPSTSTSTSPSLISHDADPDSDAEREWRESLQQLELLLTIFVVPYVGKYFGRKAAYWGWARFMEWKYPVEVVISSPATFRAAGAVQAAASL